MEKKLFTPVVFCILIFLSGAVNTQTNSHISNDLLSNKEILVNYTPHDSIMITHDDNFTIYSFPGNGSSVNPYIIENYSIITNDEIGINIEYTTKYFVIRNCYIDADQRGINIEDVKPWTTKILNNICEDNRFLGIRIFLSHGASVKNNTCINSTVGINVHSTPSVTLYNNTCIDNKFFGIKLEYSSQATIVNNTCYENNYSGIFVWDSCGMDLVNNTFYSNGQNGIHVYNTYGSTIINNTCRNNGQGIFLNLCNVATLRGNRFYNDGLMIENL